MAQPNYPGTSGDGEGFNNPYNTSVGYKASTTGNITGIYDMSGGAQEYMASHVKNNLGVSGFTEIDIEKYNTKYFDVYNIASTKQTYNYRILGDATGEMGPIRYYADADGNNRYHGSWYNDFSYFIEAPLWMRRGSMYNHGSGSGIFYFHSTTGALIYQSFRLILSPQ